MSKQGAKLYKKDIKAYKKEVKQDKIANQSTAKRATIGGLKGAGVTILGATALATAIAGIGLLKMHKQAKLVDTSFGKAMSDNLEKAAVTGFNTVKKLDLLSKLYYPALGAGIGTGAALAVSKQKQYRKNQEIEHSGIKGMKWGIRRYQNEDGTLTDAGKARYNPDGSKKKVEKMSDSELNRANQRFAAERNYYNLTGKNYKNRPGFIDISLRAGVSAVGGALASVGSYILKEKAKHPEVKLGKDKMGSAAFLGVLGATIGAVTSIGNSLGGTVQVQNIGDQKKKK